MYMYLHARIRLFINGSGQEDYSKEFFPPLSIIFSEL